MELLRAPVSTMAKPWRGAALIQPDVGDGMWQVRGAVARIGQIHCAYHDGWADALSWAEAPAGMRMPALGRKADLRCKLTKDTVRSVPRDRGFGAPGKGHNMATGPQVEEVSKRRAPGRVPEGDTVYQAARRLQAALAGKPLESSRFRRSAHAPVDLAGFVVGSVVSRGNHLLIRVADATIHSLLSAGARWDVHATGERGRSLARDASCELRNAEFQAIGTGLDVLHIIPTGREPEVVGHVGPDPLGQSWDLSEAVRRLELYPDRPIGAALVDQRLVAGLGNVYRTEVLFAAGENPHTRVGDVADLPRILGIAHQLMDTNKDRPRRMTAPVAHGAPYWVFGRAGAPCPRCEEPVLHEFAGHLPAYVDPLALARARQTGRVPEIGGRDLFWCARCQPLPAKPAEGTTPAARQRGPATGRVPTKG